MSNCPQGIDGEANGNGGLDVSVGVCENVEELYKFCCGAFDAENKVGGVTPSRCG